MRAIWETSGIHVESIWEVYMGSTWETCVMYLRMTWVPYWIPDKSHMGLMGPIQNPFSFPMWIPYVYPIWDLYSSPHGSHIIIWDLYSIYIYTYVVWGHCHHQNDSCIKMGSDKNHFNVSLIVRDKVTRQYPQTQLLKRKEGQSGFEPMSLCLSA